MPCGPLTVARSVEVGELSDVVYLKVHRARQSPVHLAGCSANPSATWVAQQATQLAWRIVDGKLRPWFLVS